MNKASKRLLLMLGLVAAIGMTGCSNNTTDENQTEVNDSATTEDTTIDGTTQDDVTVDENIEAGEEVAEENTADSVTAQIDEEEQTELNEIYEAVKEAYGEAYLPNMELDTATLQDVYGVSADLYDAVVAEVPMISFNIDTLIAVHPTEGNYDAVVAALTEYRDDLVNDTMQYPSNLAKIEASQVYESGDYVFFLMLGTVDDMIEDEAERLELFTEQNQIAIEVIDSMTK